MSLGEWFRNVNDGAIRLGHSVLGAELNGNDTQTLGVAGRGDERREVLLYSPVGRGNPYWLKEALDPAMQASSRAAGNLDGDGRVDLVCIGRATQDLTRYRNAAE